MKNKVAQTVSGLLLVIATFIVLIMGGFATIWFMFLRYFCDDPAGCNDPTSSGLLVGGTALLLLLVAIYLNWKDQYKLSACFSGLLVLVSLAWYFLA